jgi:hypothetical protein
MQYCIAYFWVSAGCSCHQHPVLTCHVPSQPRCTQLTSMLLLEAGHCQQSLAAVASIPLVVLRPIGQCPGQGTTALQSLAHCDGLTPVLAYRPCSNYNSSCFRQHCSTQSPWYMGDS